MEIYQRDFLLSKIIAGYEKVKVKDKYYKVVTPSTDILYEANYIYMDLFEKAREAELFYDSEMCDVLIREGLWSKQEEVMLIETLPQFILDFQKQMFLAAYRETERENYRLSLMQTRDKLNQLLSIRHIYDSYTCEGLAREMKYHYIIENTTYDEYNKLCDWSNISVSNIIEECNKQIITMEQIRELSRTTPWANKWQSIKGLGSIFKTDNSEWSLYQQWLVTYSKMYDNIRESPDCPDDFIMDDDDLLDGWIINQKDIRDRERAEKQGTAIVKNSKLEKANEVFIIAEGKEAIERVHNMNNARGKAVIKNRLKQVNEKDEIKWKDFSDIKQQAWTELLAAKGQK